jgi:hypothetical protein
LQRELARSILSSPSGGGRGASSRQSLPKIHKRALILKGNFVEKFWYPAAVAHRRWPVSLFAAATAAALGALAR